MCLYCTLQTKYTEPFALRNRIRLKQKFIKDDQALSDDFQGTPKTLSYRFPNSCESPPLTPLCLRLINRKEKTKNGERREEANAGPLDSFFPSTKISPGVN